MRCSQAGGSVAAGEAAEASCAAAAAAAGSVLIRVEGMVQRGCGRVGGTVWRAVDPGARLVAQPSPRSPDRCLIMSSFLCSVGGFKRSRRVCGRAGSSGRCCSTVEFEALALYEGCTNVCRVERLYTLYAMTQTL